jgi:hypothetical protein
MTRTPDRAKPVSIGAHRVALLHGWTPTAPDTYTRHGRTLTVVPATGAWARVAWTVREADGTVEHENTGVEQLDYHLMRMEHLVTVTLRLTEDEAVALVDAPLDVQFPQLPAKVRRAVAAAGIANARCLDCGALVWGADLDTHGCAQPTPNPGEER